MKLKLSKELQLPLEVAGEAIAILAKRGAGKTNTATVLVEEVVAAGVQTVVVDPVGAWWGIRASAQGEKGAGLPVPILGGQHGDVPLEQTAGALIADVVVDSGESILLDLSDFPSKGAVARFVTDFAERLYRRKGRASSLLHLVLEEADEFAPQGQRADTARMRGAIEQIVRRGRSRGLGVTLITQRSAVLNKDVLTQADVLVVMRTTGPHDVKAIREWVAARGDEHGESVIDSLPGLATGEAWVWNPERDLLVRSQVRRRRTFDSSSTPKAGEKRAAPRDVAPIDLAALGAQIQETAEKAKANDPAELRKQIRELQRQVDAKPAAAEPVVERVEVKVSAIAVDDLAGVYRHVDAARLALEEAWGELRRLERKVKQFPTKEVTDERAHARAGAAPARDRRAARADRGDAEHPHPREDRPVRPSAPVPPVAAPAEGELPLGAAKLLNVLAQFPDGRTRKQLAVLAGYRASGSTFRGAIAELRKRGYASPASVEPIVATAEGLDAASMDPLPTGRALFDQWIGQLPEGSRRVLELLYEAWPEGIPRDELATQAGYEPTGSTFRGAIALLRNLDLATPAGVDPIKAADELMES